MSSASMSAKVMSVTPQNGPREPVPELTGEELLRAARAYWPGVNEETRIVDAAMATPMSAEKSKHLDERLVASGACYGKEQIDLVKMPVFVGTRCYMVEMGYSPRFNVLAVRR